VGSGRESPLGARYTARLSLLTDNDYTLRCLPVACNGSVAGGSMSRIFAYY